MRRRSWIGARRTAVLAALLPVVTALALAGCQSGSGNHSAAGASKKTPAAPRATASPSPTGPKKASGAPVHVSLFEADGKTYGVGMPIIAYFSKKITNASLFDKVVKVTVNGQPAGGAWYWEPPSRSSAGIEAHYRLPQYWPAHSTIHVDMPLKGLPAGQGLVFDDDVTLDMNIGAAQLATVDGTPGVDTMTITSDGQPVKTLKVSLGKADTPTYLGTKLVMQKTNPEEMKSNPGDPHPYDVMVPWSVRITDSGEFIHDASWNNQIGQVNTSHGCTNLSPADAQWYYGFAQIGDPVVYQNTGTGQTVPATDGWGDWNVDWATWSRGGELQPSS